MRHPRRILVLLVTALVVVAGCAAPGSGSDARTGDGAAADPVPARPVHHEDPAGEVALCTALPTQMVGDLVSALTLDAAGDGSQCTWRLQVPIPSPAGSSPSPDLAAAAPVDATLQGAFLDLGAFHAGRPSATEAAAVADVADVGDEAFVVHLGEAEPSTLYVRDGQRTLSLWLDDVPMPPEDTERSLVRVAALLLDLA